MPTITGDVATLLGVDHTTGDPVALWVECSQPIMTVDSEGRLGGRLRVDVASDGTFEVSGLPESVDDIPLYRLVIDSRSLRQAGTRGGLTTGWFPLTADRDLTWIIANYVEVTIITPEIAAQVAAAAALGATNDTATASFVANPASATTTALSAAYAAQLTAETGDQAARLNTFLSAPSPLGVKKLVGTFNISSAIAIPAGIYVDLTAAKIISTLAAASAVTVAANATIRGGTIESPAAWDGTNVEWTYAVVHVQGSGVTIDGLTLTNFRKVGIGFDDVSDGIVTGCRITGNYPSGSWTGVETAHFGIAIDPAASSDGNFVISGNNIKSCVQGVFIGNYGSASDALGITISGNSMYGCWNHGVYGSTGASGVAVTGNAFNRCQVPVALTGSYHTVTGNTMVTTSTGDQRDISGISLRNPIGCVVAHNTIKGEMPAGNVVINLTELGGGLAIKDNVVAQNFIDVAAADSYAIRVGAGGAGVITENNLIQGNRVRRASKAAAGAISVIGASGAAGIGNQILDNEVVLTADSYGIYATFQTGTAIRGNVVRVEYDAGAAYTLPCVALNTVDGALISNNDFSISSAWGTNISIRGVWEVSGCATNRVSSNRYRFSATKTTARIEMILGSTSATVIDETGAGAPNVNAGIGSIWHRTDGGAATSLYVKESGTGATGWVGK